MILDELLDHLCYMTFSLFFYKLLQILMVVCRQDLADIIPRATFLWKLELLKSAGAYVNSRLHAVEADVLVLARLENLSFHCYWLLDFSG